LSYSVSVHVAVGVGDAAEIPDPVVAVELLGVRARGRVLDRQDPLLEVVEAVVAELRDEAFTSVSEVLLPTRSSGTKPPAPRHF
jgi:hypothetical protein